MGQNANKIVICLDLVNQNDFDVMPYQMYIAKLILKINESGLSWVKDT